MLNMRSLDEIHLYHPDDWRDEAHREGYTAKAIDQYQADFAAALAAMETDTPVLPGKPEDQQVPSIDGVTTQAVLDAVVGGARTVEEVAWAAFLPVRTAGAALVAALRAQMQDKTPLRDSD